jgi:MFS family permease
MAEPAAGAPARQHAVGLAALLVALMLPVTLPVPVLRGLVQQRFELTDALAALFMAANMLGALVAAPLVGLLADRTGKRRAPACLALVADAALMQAMAHAPTFASFLALRAFEGAAHITALSLVLSLAADAAGARRGRVMGAVGAGLTLGVATGAAVGGQIGQRDPLLTLHLGSGVLLLAALLALAVLPRDLPVLARPGLREIARAALAQPRLRAPLFMAFLDRFTVGFFTTGFPLMVQGVHGAPATRVGLLLALFLYPFALLSYPFGRLADRLPAIALVVWGSAIYGVGTMVVGSSPAEWLLPLMPVLGLASAVMFVPTLLLTLERAPQVGRATAIAGFNAAGSLGFLLGPLTCAGVVRLAPDAASGYAWAFAVAGASQLLGVALLLPSLRAGRAAAPQP